MVISCGSSCTVLGVSDLPGMTQHMAASSAKKQKKKQKTNDRSIKTNTLVPVPVPSSWIGVRGVGKITSNGDVSVARQSRAGARERGGDVASVACARIGLAVSI
jgi:hypothetical protein